MKSPPSVSATAFPPERPSNIALFGAAQAVSSIGGWAQKAAVGWLCWEMTHSPAWVGALALTDAVAAVAIGPLAGALVDRTSPYRMILSTQSLQVVQSVVLGVLALTGMLNLPLLFALALAESFINGFNQPARMTIINFLAGRERLSQAIALNSIAVNVARIGGPAGAGVMMLHYPIGVIFLINATTYFAMIGAVLYLRPWADRQPTRTELNLFGDITAGFRYIAGAPEISTIFLLAAAFCFLARPMTELMPAVAGDIFKGGPTSLSALMSAQGIGAMFGATWMLRRRQSRALVHIAFGSALAAAVTLIVFCVSGSLRAAVILIGVFGAFHVICNVGMQSLTQTFAEAAYRGRVVALYSLFFRAAPSMGAFVIGLAASYFGLRVLVCVAAMAAVAVIGWIALRAGRVFSAAAAPAAE